jgi:hypothetical protein
MSDVSRGPGWWMASDGKWYPPELHPSVREPVGQPVSQARYAGTAGATATGDPSQPGSFGGATGTIAWPTAGMAYDNPVTGPRHGPSPRRRLRWMIPVGSVVAVAVLALAVVVVTSGPNKGWTNDSLHVVGSPVVSDNSVLVLDVTAGHSLELSGVNPATGSVVWRHPFSPSQITAGEAFGPTVLGDTVLALTPVAGSGNPTVKAQGLDVVTGKVLWTVPQPIDLSDAPAVCAGGRYFCLDAFLTDTTTGLIVLKPKTGSVVGVISGPLRNMGVAQPGSTTEGDLWQTSATTPTLAQTSATGQLVWTHTVASLFGGSNYDPDDGWDFLIQDSLDVGSIGTTSSGPDLSLSDSKTVGISGSDGTVKWTVPGYLLCGGGLQFLTADVVCRYSGTAHQTATSFSMSGISLTILGLDPSSGKTTWSQPVLGTQALSEGTNVAFADGTHLVVQLPSRQRVVLDVRSGATSAVTGHQVFWCEQIPVFKVDTFKGAEGGGKRESEPVFRPCTATGKASAGLPATGPSTVGVRTGGLFIWPSPHGLQAARIPA